MSEYTDDLKMRVRVTLCVMKTGGSSESEMDLVAKLVECAYVEGQADMLACVEKTIYGGKK